MNSAIERLLGLRVKDVMRREVMTIDLSESIKSAAHKLFTAEVTGAPVIDSGGRCVGVISGSDFVGKEADAHEMQLIVQPDPDAPYEIEVLNEELVSSHMSDEVSSISPEATLLQAARRMCQQHIHRLIVLDEAEHPVGILSSLDVVAAMVAVFEE